MLWVPCHHGMARPQVVDGGNGFQVWRVAANIVHKQSRAARKEVRRRANNSLPLKNILLQNVRHGLGLGWILWNGQCNGKWI
jgi:hypothetical protein